MQESSQEALVTTREKWLWTVPIVAISAVSFLYVDARNAALTAAPLRLETRLDPWIPFVSQFVFAYLLYYPWLFIPLRVLRTRESFFRGLCAFALMQLFAEAVFILYPSHIERPPVVGTGLSETLVRWLYALDAGWNLFPSLHVGHSVLVALIYRKYVRSGTLLVWTGTLLICASTVLIKQHFVVDILSGGLLAAACYAAAWQALPVARSLRLFRPDAQA
jgi:membrane-associated phospholipid phosphatase